MAAWGLRSRLLEAWKLYEVQQEASKDPAATQIHLQPLSAWQLVRTPKGHRVPQHLLTSGTFVPFRKGHGLAGATPTTLMLEEQALQGGAS